MKTAVIGYPRIGEKRELKKATESYFKGNLSKEDLINAASEIKKKQWEFQKKAGIDYITSNDFSFYDLFLDTAFMLNVIPKRYLDLNLDSLDCYFAMAKGYQDEKSDVKALPMKKWFNTNYHYIVSEIEEKTEFKLNSEKLVSEYLEAKSLGIETKPTVIGPFTFLKLIKIKANNKTYNDYIKDIVKIYKELLSELKNHNIQYLQIEEPSLVTDLEKYDIENFNSIYKDLLSESDSVNIILQTYFGDLRDIYKDIINHDFYAIGLDLVEGKENLNLIKKYGFPNEKFLFAGLVNGKNIWKNSFKSSIEILNKLRENIEIKNLVINSSCSLLHSPYTLRYENLLDDNYKIYLAFAEEKLNEIQELKEISLSENYKENKLYTANETIINSKLKLKDFYKTEVYKRVNNLNKEDFNRNSEFKDRIKKQNEILNLPLLPTTTIGSFPQTKELRKIRRDYKNGLINSFEYENYIKEKIDDIIKLQEDIGLDILVHGEFERNDMVEYFGENLGGFLFTENAWVQSYGTRAVKPPILFGDVYRKENITSKWINYANSIIQKPVKAMLTGPVTIQNWSFVREDLDLETIAYQIALAIQEEVLDLEKDGTEIIQIDEAALREKLPLRKSEWKDYLNWAVKAFKLSHSKVKDKTQIHTHMCYSEFDDIIDSIKALDADVITIEAAKSDLSILKTLKENSYENQLGPGVYDIHSARVPSEEELLTIIKKMCKLFDSDNLWINPDCGLKTRGEKETLLSLKNMVNATKQIRNEI